MHPHHRLLLTLAIALGVATPSIAEALERPSLSLHSKTSQSAPTHQARTRGLSVLATGWSVAPSTRPGETAQETDRQSGRAARHPEAPIITDAWIRQPPPGSRMLAGYLSFRNDTAASIALTDATCDAFEEVQIHTIARDPASGMVRMVRLNELVIPARQTLVMAPGHDHLMLIGPKRDLQPGEKLTLTLYFGKSIKQQVVAEVRGRARPAS